jgi:hypothetical protein
MLSEWLCTSVWWVLVHNMLAAVHHVASWCLLKIFCANISGTSSWLHYWWQQVHIIFSLIMIINFGSSSIKFELKFQFFPFSIRVLPFRESVNLLFRVTFEISYVNGWWVINCQHSRRNVGINFLLTFIRLWYRESLDIYFLNWFNGNLSRCYLLNLCGLRV